MHGQPNIKNSYCGLMGCDNVHFSDTEVSKEYAASTFMVHITQYKMS